MAPLATISAKVAVGALIGEAIPAECPADRRWSRLAAVPDNSPVGFRVDDLVIDRESRRVMRGSRTLKLGALTYDLLLALVEAAPAMASYDELAEKVWPGRTVTPETIAQRARLLREALSDDAKSPRYFELIRGHGYRLLPNAEPLAGPLTEPDPELTAGPTQKLSMNAGILGAAALAALLALAVWAMSREPANDSPSVAVLPFADLSPDGDQRYLADGIAEELINQLSALDGLDVASRTESFYYPGPIEDLQQIGKALGVSAILEGSVRKNVDKLRVTVQLIDTKSGFHLWSDTFDRQLQDILVIQEDIAAAVAGALGVTLGVGGVNEFRGAGTRNFEAYEAFLRRDFETALQLDPNYAAAWGRQGIQIASTMWFRSPQEAPAIIERAYQHVARAVELDPNSARAWADFGMLNYAKMDWQPAELAFRQSFKLNRSSDALGSHANMLMRAGRSRAALALHSEQEALSRVPLQMSLSRLEVHIALGRIDEAWSKLELVSEDLRAYARLILTLNDGSAEEVRAVIAAMPGHTIAFRDLYTPLLELFDQPEAALDFLRGLAQDPDRMWPSKFRTIALLAAWFGDPELAFEVFSNELPHTNIRYGTLWNPIMSDMRRLPAFTRFLHEVNLVDYWRNHGWSDFCRPLGRDELVCQ